MGAINRTTVFAKFLFWETPPKSNQ